jgi:uncharacterized membrane protein
MGKIIRKNWRARLLICAAIVTISLLFIGAGKVTKELSGRKDTRRLENKRWEAILIEMGKEVPSKYKSEWNKIVNSKPEGLMHAVAITKN